MSQKCTDFSEKKALLAALLRDSASAADELAMPQLYEKLKLLGMKIGGDTLKIPVVGRFACGKTTFVNALLGENVLSARMLPFMKVPCEVKYGEERRAVLHFGSPLPTKLLPGIPAAVRAHIQRYGMKDVPPMDIEYDQVDRFVEFPFDGDAYEISQVCPYRSVELFYPSPLLKNGVEIIDLPAYNESDEQHAAMVEYLDKVDAIIYLFDAFCLCAQDEMEFVEDVLLSKDIDKIFFVVNRFDLVPESDREMLVRYCECKLKAFPKEGIFPISSLQAVTAGANGNEGLYKQSGMELLVEQLTDFVTRERRIKLAQVAHELKDILAKELLTELGDMQRAQLVLPALYNELVSLEKRKQQLRDSMQLKIEQCKCDLRRGVIDEYARVESEIRIWVHEYQPRTRIRFMSMDSVKEMSIEVVEHVRLKIRERFNGWYKDVFTPLINKYCDEIIISNGKELNDIVTEIFRVQEQLPVVNADNTDKQVASLADSIGFRDSIPYPFMLDSLKELEQRISLNLSSFGIICDPFPFPFAPLMELLLKVCLTSGNNLIRNMKDAISQGVIRKLHEDAPVKADDIANKAVGEFMEYVDDVMSAIDIEIEKARIQVTGINEVNWDKEYLSCHKQLIVRIEKRVQDIYIELDNMMFELLEA